MNGKIILIFRMPFQSKSQMRVCYTLKKKNPKSTWNCDEWLKETKNPECLPEKKGGERKCKSVTVLGKTLYGKRGGRYFMFGDRKIYF